MDESIPFCDRPASRVVTYRPGGPGSPERRLAYCAEHADLFTKSLAVRREPFTDAPLHSTEPCHAWRDV